jgi:hypothetical protein
MHTLGARAKQRKHRYDGSSNQKTPDHLHAFLHAPLHDGVRRITLRATIVILLSYQFARCPIASP